MKPTHNTLAKFNEDAKVLEWKLCSCGAEADVVLEIKGKRLYCFVPNYPSDVFSPNERCTVLLSLMTFPGVEEIKPAEGEIYSFLAKGSSNRCKLQGKIIKILPPEKEGFSALALIDCSLFVKIEVLSGKFKPGACIRAEGRLDVYKIKQL